MHGVEIKHFIFGSSIALQMQHKVKTWDTQLGYKPSCLSRFCHFGLLPLSKESAGLCCRKQLGSQKPRVLQPGLSCSERLDGKCIVNFEFSGKSANLNNVSSEAVQLDFRLYLSCRSRPKILRNLSLSFLCLMHVIYSITGVECQLSTSVRGWGQRGSPNYRFWKKKTVKSCGFMKLAVHVIFQFQKKTWAQIYVMRVFCEIAL